MQCGERRPAVSLGKEGVIRRQCQARRQRQAGLLQNAAKQEQLEALRLTN
jgi:hypothetical protein